MATDTLPERSATPSSSRRSGRLAGLLWAATALATAAGAYFERTAPPQAAAEAPGPRYLYFIVVLVAACTGALLAARRPGNPIGWLLGLSGFSLACQGFFQWYGLDVWLRGGSLPPPLFAAVAITNALWLPTIGITLLVIPLIFPDGRLPSRRWRHVLWVAAVAMTVAVVGTWLDPQAQGGDSFGDPLASFGVQPVGQVLGSIGFLTVMLCLVAAAVSVVMRYRRGGEELRHQLKWFAAAVVVMVLIFVLDGMLTPPSVPVLDVLAVVAQAGVPLAITIAILKYRLYDIDAFISKSLAYGTLAGVITAVYVAIVVGIGSLVGSGRQANLALSILATAVVAVGFQPVRERLQRIANRLVYGKRATPYEVLAEFSHRMAGTLSAMDVLPRMAEAAVRGVSARSARVRLFLADGSERSSLWPENGPPPAIFDRTMDVLDNGERIGEIAVAKAAGDPITPVESSLLSDLATQSELVLHNARLTVELEARLAEISAQAGEISASRQRLITARDLQRRRLERTLHNGVQRSLAGIAAELEAAEGRLRSDPTGAAAMLDALTGRATSTLDELRDVARGIFPPLLVDQGLVPALLAHLRKSGVDVEVGADAEAASARFEPQLEAAVYFTCVEALRGAGAGGADAAPRVGLCSRHGWLEFSISPAATPADELLEMRDRVEALGGELAVERDGDGNTTLAGRVPSGWPAESAMAATA